MHLESLTFALLPLFMQLDQSNASPAPEPPVAAVVPHRLEAHGDVRIDDYFWLNQREDPEVIAYLERENAYTAAMTKHTGELRKRLFDEIKGRIAQDDSSVPYPFDGFFYYSRMEEGKSYPIYCRKQGSLEADEEVILDVNELAEGHDFCSVGGLLPGPDHRLIGYGIDTVGRRKYTLTFVALESGEKLDEIPDVTGNFVWAADGETVFYTRQDPGTLRSYQVYRHVLGSDHADDVLVYEEEDDTFSVRLSRTKSREYLLIGSRQTLRTEWRYLPADRPDGEWSVFWPREANHEYSIDHLGDRWVIRTNAGAENFRLMEAPVEQTAREHWKELLPASGDTFIVDFELFDDYLVVAERREGLVRLRIRPTDGKPEHHVDFGEPAYSASLSINLMPETKVLRYSYTSMTTPRSTFDYDMETRQKQLLKEEPVLGGFDKSGYETLRIHAKARDGASVPISLVYRKGLERNGDNPLLLYAYGSYGMTIDASFRSSRLSLLDRGFVFAIAHVRGSQIYGRPWYEDGKLLRKRNTFTDFIDAAEHLLNEGFTSPRKLFAQGGSAGGLLIGAVVNMRPDLFAGAVAAVPFVDVVTTMLDESIPLTTSEYDEWGNPNDPAFYEYMLSYSPYDNVVAQDYPHMLVTTGLHDSQVQYWEPAKWVAKLRATKTDDRRLLLKTDMDAGHGGASGRYKQYEDIAFEYAFLLDLAGIRN